MTINLFDAAEECLRSCDIDSKCLTAKQLFSDWQAGRLVLAGRAPAAGPAEAGRPPKPLLVAPRELARRGLGNREGQAALIHAVAHIEFNAINLACDAVYRFRNLPAAYYGDWLKVAAEEAYHFSLLRNRLEQLGYAYGDFSAHDGLWELARKTAHDPLLRMALVPRVMEARSLDVTPGMRKRFVAIGDQQTAAVLDIILRDEVGHVEVGSRWFRYLCEQRGVEPEETYFALLDEHMDNNIRCPLHLSARREAGFSDSELERLEALCKKS